MKLRHFVSVSSSYSVAQWQFGRATVRGAASEALTAAVVLVGPYPCHLRSWLPHLVAWTNQRAQYTEKADPPKSPDSSSSIHHSDNNPPSITIREESQDQHSIHPPLRRRFCPVSQRDRQKYTQPVTMSSRQWLSSAMRQCHNALSRPSPSPATCKLFSTSSPAEAADCTTPFCNATLN